MIKTRLIYVSDKIALFKNMIVLFMYDVSSLRTNKSSTSHRDRVWYRTINCGCFGLHLRKCCIWFYKVDVLLYLCFGSGTWSNCCGYIRFFISRLISKELQVQLQKCRSDKPEPLIKQLLNMVHLCLLQGARTFKQLFTSLKIPIFLNAFYSFYKIYLLEHPQVLPFYLLTSQQWPGKLLIP